MLIFALPFFVTKYQNDVWGTKMPMLQIFFSEIDIYEDWYLTAE